MKKFSLVFFALAFVSCVSVKNMRYPVRVTNSRAVDLLPAAAMDGKIDDVFLFSAQFGKTRFSAKTFLHMDGEKIFALLLNEFDFEIGNLLYENGKLAFHSDFIPAKIPSRYIIADLQFIFYDADILRTVFLKNKLDFVTEKTAAGEVRKIFSGGRLIEKIEKSGNKIMLKNYLRDYEYVFLQERR